jgi:hypothetical protein
MKSSHSMFVIAAAAAVLFGYVALEAVDTSVNFDKAFDFRPVKTWAWDRTEPGVVRMARTQHDNPEEMQRKADPWIRDEMAKEMKARGLTEASGSLAPDLTAKYYMLLTLNVETQTVGQFLPAPVVAWGLPPLMAPATQSDKVLNRGSMVLDFSAKGNVVWRGVAQSHLAPDSGDKKREERVREAIRDLVKRFPPK